MTLMNLARKARPDHHPLFAEWFSTVRLIHPGGATVNDATQTRYIRVLHWQSRPTKDFMTSQRDSILYLYAINIDGTRSGYLYHDVITHYNNKVEDFNSHTDPFGGYQLNIPNRAYEYIGNAEEKSDTGLHDNAINEVVDKWFNKDGDSVNIQGQPS